MIRERRGSREKRWLWGFILGFSMLFFFLSPPRRIELVSDEGEAVLSFPVRLGESFLTEYIHSVQLCPVVDEYYVVGNFIWLWEERTQSTNAGLPTEAPYLGRFAHNPPWYRYTGGRHAFTSFRLRVGDAQTGRNVLTLPSGGQVNLFERFTGRVLTLRVR